jgi:putative flippase GtrA
MALEVLPFGRVIAQLGKYSAAGAVGTAIQYVILFGLVEGFAVGAIVASTVGAIAGALINYALNYRYTFKSKRPHVDALTRYGVVSVAGIVLNGFVLMAGTSALGLHYFAAQVLATLVVLLAAFTLNRAWSF